MEQIATADVMDTSLAAHIMAETPSVDDAAGVASKPAVEAAATVAPEVEADSATPDAELSEAGRALRRNRADTRKAKIQQEISDGVKEREAVRAEVARLKVERDALARGEAPTRAEATTARPKLADYESFEEYEAARDEWAFQEAERRAETRIQERDRTRAEQAQAERLTQRAATAREKYADYDAVIEPAIQQFADNPRASAVSEFIAASEVGGELFYRLANDATALQAVLTATSQVALARELARLETQILQPSPAVQPQTKAPAPPRKTVGSSATATDLDTRKGVPLSDHIRIEERELAERRKLGYRD